MLATCVAHALTNSAGFTTSGRCRHCSVDPVSRPRGLCWTCYYTSDVRALYPSASKFGRRGNGLGSAKANPTAFPTDAKPGSEAKVRVLMERMELRQDLWHPKDAGWSSEP
jgi:hypothetical protein